MFISHCAGGCKSGGRVPVRRGCDEDPPAGLQEPPSHCILAWLREKSDHLSWVFSYKGTNLSHRSSTLRPNYLPKSPPPDAITLRGRVSTYEFWGSANIQCPAGGHYFFCHFRLMWAKYATVVKQKFPSREKHIFSVSTFQCAKVTKVES